MATDAPAVRYRPHLDGLRAVAVYLVVAFHAGLGSFDGGFVGVDVFFVLSGFLVTKILLVDLVGQGRLDFRRFYARRSRRILPAALFVLIVTAVLYRLMAPPVAAFEAMGGFRAASVYVANWFFIGQSTDYFASDLASSPVLHFWSLAVEEQFYLLWPLLLGGLFVAVRRIGSTRWVVLRAIVGALALASAIAAVLIGADDVARAYYGTDTRAYQLLVGALLALTPQLSRLGGRPRRVVAGSAVPAVAAIVILSTPLVGVGPITRGLLVTAATALLILALENTRGGPTVAFLASGPMTALGRVSYGTYLWHWPIIVLIALEVDLPPVANFAIAAVGATGLAAISYVLMERPIRTTPRVDYRASAVVATGLACSLVAGFLVMPQLLDSGDSEVITASGAKADWQQARADIPRRAECLGKSVAACTLVAGPGPHVLLLGDSHARMWIPAMVRLARQEGLTFSAAIKTGCPWILEVIYWGQRTKAASCNAHREDLYDRVLPELDPDIVVLAQLDPEGSDDVDRHKAIVSAQGTRMEPRDPGFDRILGDRIEASLDRLVSSGRLVVVVESTPVAPVGDDPLTCLSTGRVSAECAFPALSDPTQLERILRARAEVEPMVRTIDLDRVVCPRSPHCDAVIGDVIVWRDEQHLTATFARSLAPAVGKALADAGVDLRP